MTLWEEAEIIRVAGIEVYAFGVMVALGALCAAVTICALSWLRRCRKGTGPLTVCLCILIGAACSRLVFCLLNRDLGILMPFFSWFEISGGGWSMMGLVGGAMLAGWLSAKILGEKPAKVLDLVACGLPVFMAFERAAEGWIPEFDYSRVLESKWLAESFLATNDGVDAFLATWRLAAAFSAVLFICLMIAALRGKRWPGDICILFLLYFGAGSIILESLRYDMFLSISFVGIQQILALVVLIAGAVAAVKRADPAAPKGLKLATLISAPLAGLIGLGLEFALDRTTVNRFLIYAVMILTMLTPAVLGTILIRRNNKDYGKV